MAAWWGSILAHHSDKGRKKLNFGRLELDINIFHMHFSVLLHVPELMPFRFTRQFQNLLAPLDTAGLLRQDMVYTLQALRAQSQTILTIMEVFVKVRFVRAEVTKCARNPKWTGLNLLGAL